ncbi:arylsulfatase [Flavobacteriaceae bacterium]|nr:arylsulfatase [Flavobacteriaceae bacterium]MDA8762959.1 arylsulfatase [Flavobacteriaceae bacterium]
MKNLIFLFALILFTNCNNTAPKPKNSKPPNIIYILADDLGYGDIGVYGQTLFETPNLDRLAKGGMQFLQHYSGSTVCAPSRSALMTGQHTGHTFIRGNSERGFTLENEGQYPLASEELTIAEALKEAGYRTAAFGKWGLGYPGSEGAPNSQGFDQFYGYNCQRVAHNYYPTHLWDNQLKEDLKGNDGNTAQTYAPELIHQKALSFLEENKDAPFFMFYPSVIPHAELVAPEEYMVKYRGKFLPEKKHVNAKKKDGYSVSGYNSQVESHAAFAAMVNILDDQVGEIMDKVHELGIAENTLIIFTSDNGPHKEGGADPDYFDSNGPLKGYKRDLYEGGIRVPMMAYWPSKIQPGSTSNHPSAFWDFFPTAIEIAGVKKEFAGIDGISFLPTLVGKEQKSHPYLYWEFLERGGRQAVLMNQWKGIRLNMAKNPDAHIELYRLTDDIGEENNLAQEYPQIVKKMDRLMKEAHVNSEIFSFEYEKN